jgi:hypothetical protein
LGGGVVLNIARWSDQGKKKRRKKKKKEKKEKKIPTESSRPKNDMGIDSQKFAE